MTKNLQFSGLFFLVNRGKALLFFQCYLLNKN